MTKTNKEIIAKLQKKIDAYQGPAVLRPDLTEVATTINILKMQDEIADLKLELVCLQKENDRLRSQVSDDTKRIDWIDRNMDCDLSGPGLHVSSVEIGDTETLRQAIDRVAAELDRSEL